MRRKVPSTRGELKKRKRYRRSRRQGRNLLVALALAFLLISLFLEAPDAVRRLTHPIKHEEVIRSAAAEYKVEPALVAAVIRSESNFDEDVESSRGAYGLMQLLPETASFIAGRSGIGGDYREPETNIRMGTWYLGYLQNRYNGDERLVLAAYNSGASQVDEWVSEEGFNVSRDIPFEETREYVNEVLDARDTYVDLYGRNLNRAPR